MERFLYDVGQFISVIIKNTLTLTLECGGIFFVYGIKNNSVQKRTELLSKEKTLNEKECQRLKLVLLVVYHNIAYFVNNLSAF